MKTLGRVMWPLNETAILTVKKPGGLEQGEHEVQVITDISHRTFHQEWTQCTLRWQSADQTHVSSSLYNIITSKQAASLDFSSGAVF